MRNILVIGNTGLVGSGISTYFNEIEDVELKTIDLSEDFDLTDRKSIQDFFKRNNRIQYIVNCSGLNDHVENKKNEKNLMKTDLEFLDKYYEINVKAVCFLVEEAFQILPDICSLVNFSSLYGKRSPYHPIYNDPKSLSYTITKHALEGITKYYAGFYGNKGLRINSVRIGGINSNQPKKFREWFISRTPLGRLAEVNDLYGAVDFLSSEESRYITGQSITVDGGYTIW